MAVVGPELSYDEYMGEAPRFSCGSLHFPKIRVPRFRLPFLVIDEHYTVMSALDVSMPIPNEPQPPRYITLNFGLTRRNLTDLTRLVITHLRIMS